MTGRDVIVNKRMLTPALAVDGEVQLVGRDATPEEIQKFLS